MTAAGEAWRIAVSSADGLFERIVMQSPDAMIVADAGGVIRIWNAAASALFGHEAADAVGRSLDLIIPERLRAAHWDAFHRAVDRGRTQHDGPVRTTRALHGSGSRLYVEMSFGLVSDGDGRVVASVAIARDVTARHEAEAARRSAGTGHGAGPATG